MIYPTKLQTELTQACVDLHNAKNPNDINSVLEIKLLVESSGFNFPKWMEMWIQWFKNAPMLTAEEYFKENTFNVFDELIKIEAAINTLSANYSVSMRNALFVIAAQILHQNDEFADGLGFEFHCKVTYTESLTERNNYSVFIQMLSREIEFWDDSVKPRLKTPQKFQLNPQAKLSGINI